ncbi:phytanoyl-CoA dioxygenase family protein [Tolypothrix sp. VBCCA 56010]|uniref:phytanoyl-CoA dioxygenase family protein n=1 Tax=Tolypothrix sp. VBCCA 56010 TaxID=3137731 RepID=UPI003D7CA95A
MKISLTSEDVQKFRNDGVLLVPNILEPSIIAKILARIPSMLKGEYATGIKPAEIKIDPTNTQQISGKLWESEPEIKAVVLDPELGRACAILGDWEQYGSKAVHSSLWRKPPGAPETTIHQDAAYVDTFIPNKLITALIALENMTIEAGSTQYILGSHKWGLGRRVRSLRESEDYTAEAKTAAREAGVGNFEIFTTNVESGTIVFHDGLLWHGAGRNNSQQQRVALSCAIMPANIKTVSVDDPYVFGEASEYPFTWQGKLI